MKKHGIQPVIIIVAYNRIHTLERILGSLDRALCPEGTKLIISIDNNGQNEEVVAVANKYEWKRGDKEVIYHSKRMGLRNHLFACGDLCYQYDSVIILEDDLVVSPYFYDFTVETLEYYKDSDEIAGISLYKLPYTEATKLPFIPLVENSDVFFQQVPCSLGMAYTKDQWDSFKKWFASNPDLTTINGLPIIVSKYWSESSWKKYIYGYMVTNNKYFVYPQISLTSNFNDRGENMYAKSYMGQVGLQMVPIDYKFKSLADSINVYDAYSEILPDRLKKLCPSLSDFDFEVDLFGQKESFSKEFVITSKHCDKKIRSFERTMKPAELNIIYNIPGNEICLSRSEDVIFDLQFINNIIFKTKPVEDFINDFHYFYIHIFDNRRIIQILKFRLGDKIKRLLKLN